MKKSKLTKDEIKRRIIYEEDFINSPKYNYSLSLLEKNNPNGVTDHFAAALLMISVKNFQNIFQSTVEKYRQLLKTNIKLK